MVKDIFFDLLDWGEEIAEEFEMPLPSMDWLPKAEESITFQQTASNVVVKSFVNGKRTMHVSIDILARGHNDSRQKLIGYLILFREKFMELKGSANAISGYSLGNVDATTPSIRTRDSNLITTYGLSVGIDYEVIQ